ncbi:type ISP restriction/modification enzyme [Acinetobacter colistiniresistens]|uniref:Type ISP restriction-modification enzyme LLaBIII C-terminal specificity domain-containing protein n=1 Tax=Acinetobacter colistiniresistens TaxID=280145 RepID=S3UQ15_9GAMM|nr:type ISP restriction/modification enzyme [Acinetobacter colistiniresistens]EPG41657.1 hypothetical protein F907_00533 [Acinetobacter colistiniresistens]TVT79192.1 hypothetical protein FPV60_15370 [Acinetobacter colistiniresistens]
MFENNQRQSYFKSSELILSLAPLTLNPDIILTLEKSLGLVFIHEEASPQVCFANQNTELQDAYKQVFSAVDLVDYVYAILNSEKQRTEEIQLLNPTLAPIPYPTDHLLFWKLVTIGQRYRLSQH